MFNWRYIFFSKNYRNCIFGTSIIPLFDYSSDYNDFRICQSSKVMFSSSFISFDWILFILVFSFFIFFVIMDFYSRASQGFFFKNILSSPVFIENELDDFSEIFMVHFSGIINSNDDFFYSSSFYIYESLFSGKAPSNISYRPKPFIIFNILLFIFFFIFFAYFIVFFPSSTNSFYLSNSNFSNGSSINFIQYTFINFSAYSTILVHFFMFNKISSYVIFMSFFSVFFLIFFTFIFNYKDESFYLDSYDLFFYVSIFLMVFNFIYISFSINLLVVYIGVEFFSIIMYMLIGLYSGNEIISSSRRAELGIKYLMASFLGSVTILVGLSFIYLSYSDFNMSKYYYLYIALPYEYSVFGSAPKVSIIIFIIGLSIKVGLAPFHSWINGVYDSFNNKLFQFVIIYPKFFIFSIIINIVFTSYFIFYNVFESNITFNNFSNFFTIMGFIGVFVGSVSAAFQFNLKRILMYSSIANSGYIMLALSNGFVYNYSAFIYLFMYFFSINFFFFVFNSIFSRRSYYCSHSIWSIKSFSTISDFSDKFSLTIAFLNFSGIPPFVIFFAKLPIVIEFISSGRYWSLFGFLMLSIISAYYNVRPIFYIWFYNTRQNNFFTTLYSSPLKCSSKSYSFKIFNLNFIEHYNFRLINEVSLTHFYINFIDFIKRIFICFSFFSGYIVSFLFVSLEYFRHCGTTGLLEGMGIYDYNSQSKQSVFSQNYLLDYINNFNYWSTFNPNTNIFSPIYGTSAYGFMGSIMSDISIAEANVICYSFFICFFFFMYSFLSIYSSSFNNFKPKNIPVKKMFFIFFRFEKNIDFSRIPLKSLFFILIHNTFSLVFKVSSITNYFFFFIMFIDWVFKRFNLTLSSFFSRFYIFNIVVYNYLRFYYIFKFIADVSFIFFAYSYFSGAYDWEYIANYNGVTEMSSITYFIHYIFFIFFSFPIIVLEGVSSFIFLKFTYSLCFFIFFVCSNFSFFKLFIIIFYFYFIHKPFNQFFIIKYTVNYVKKYIFSFGESFYFFIQYFIVLDETIREFFKFISEKL